MDIISVIVSIRNMEKKLDRYVNSIVNQTYHVFAEEELIVNDETYSRAIVSLPPSMLRELIFCNQSEINFIEQKCYPGII